MQNGQSKAQNNSAFIIEANKDALKIRLPVECVIAETEALMSALKHALSNSPQAIELSAGRAKVFDTAYLQLILSLKAAAARRDIPFDVVNMSPEVERVCGLYGVEI